MFPGGGNGTLLQYSCLENPTDSGAWWAAVCRAAESQTRLKRLSTHAQGMKHVSCNTFSSIFVFFRFLFLHFFFFFFLLFWVYYIFFSFLEIELFLSCEATRWMLDHFSQKAVIKYDPFSGSQAESVLSLVIQCIFICFCRLFCYLNSNKMDL